jgi:hypothetical protein
VRLFVAIEMNLDTQNTVLDCVTRTPKDEVNTVAVKGELGSSDTSRRGLTSKGESVQVVMGMWLVRMRAVLPNTQLWIPSATVVLMNDIIIFLWFGKKVKSMNLPSARLTRFNKTDESTRKISVDVLWRIFSK